MLRLAMLVICAASSAQALCDDAEKLVMSCTLKDASQALDVCHQQGEARYRYGPRNGAPELKLSTSIRDLEYRPWAGVGGSIYEEVAFYNGDIRYAVWSAFERDPEGNYPLSGGVIVTKGDQTLADLTCDTGSVNTAMDTLFEEKQARGLCWDSVNFAWKPCAE